MNATSAPLVASARHEHPVLVIEVPTPLPGGEGPRDIDQLSDADTVWLSDDVKQIDLRLSLTSAVISVIVGTVVAAMIMAVIAKGAGVAVVVASDVIAGAVVVVIVGEAVNAIVNVAGLRKRLKRALRKSEAVPDDLYQGMMTTP